MVTIVVCKVAKLQQNPVRFSGDVAGGDSIDVMSGQSFFPTVQLRYGVP